MGHDLTPLILAILTLSCVIHLLPSQHGITTPKFKMVGACSIHTVCDSLIQTAHMARTKPLHLLSGLLEEPFLRFKK